MFGQVGVTLHTRTSSVFNEDCAVDCQIVTAATIGGNRYELGADDTVGGARRHDFCLPSLIASHLKIFLAQIYGSDAPSDCFSFMCFVMGFSGNKHVFPVEMSLHLSPVNPRHTSRAKAYVIAKDRKSVHSMIGIGSGLTLGVNGTNGALIVAGGVDLYRIYRGDSMQEVLNA